MEADVLTGEVNNTVIGIMVLTLLDLLEVQYSQLMMDGYIMDGIHMELTMQ
ncbi:MAG: hypothetical protein Q9M91_04185 [Candidatus Dojkabacteria bacterium]|nr:hypothetical protein [Candidatus Dojkabacteria bacterium]